MVRVSNLTERLVSSLIWYWAVNVIRVYFRSLVVLPMLCKKWVVLALMPTKNG